MELDCVIIKGYPASNTRSVTGAVAVQATITILDATLRIIGVDLSKLNLGEDYPGQPVEYLLDALTCEGRDLNSNGDIGLRCPTRTFLEADLAALGGIGCGHSRPSRSSKITNGPERATARVKRERRLFAGYTGWCLGMFCGGIIRALGLQEVIRCEVKLVPCKQDGKVR